MISSLRIQNYALINNLDIQFHQGLNIITGETGAGKSILLGALSLVLGKRADLSVLYNKDKKCIIETDFNIKDYQLQHFFKDNELDYDDLTIVRREISPNGKSRSFINDTPVILPVLQELSTFLIDIHSQHQNLSLNNQQYLINIIDEVSDAVDLRKEYQKIYREYTETKKRYLELDESTKRGNQETEFIKHQLQELENAKLLPGELENLEADLEQLEHSEEIKESLNKVIDFFDNEELGVISIIKECERSLEKIAKVYHTSADFLERLLPIQIELQELSRDIGSSFENVDLDPQKIEYTRERISLLYTLLTKHRVKTNDELIEIKGDLAKRLNNHENNSYELEQLAKKVQKLEAIINEKAQKLSKRRASSFESFSGKIKEILTDLGIQHSKFQVSRTNTEFSILGIDKIRFMFSANKNSELQDITKVASGGELSRLMLAIKYLNSHAAGLPTIIFDEIDSGVSGEIADKVGRIIGEMSTGMQVINITHLPQVASKGNHHYLVYKAHNEKRTYTNIKLLSDQERLEEIAKMLSGEKLTEAAIANARDLLGVK